MIVELAQLVDLRSTCYLRARPLDVFQVLTATRVRTKDGGDETERPVDAVCAHLPQRVGQERMPVAIAPIDGKLQPVAGQFQFERGDQFAVVIVDRALAAEMIIMLRDGQHPLARYIAPAQDILKKRYDVVRLFGPSE